MTVTVTKLYSTSFYTAKGTKKIMGIFRLSFTGTYTAGGDTVDLSPYFSNLDCIVPLTSGGYLFEVDSDSFNTPNAVKIKVIYPTKSQSSSLSISASVDYVVGSATEYVPNDSELGGTALNANGTIPVAVSIADAHGEVDAGPGEELADGASYPADLSCVVLVFGS